MDVYILKENIFNYNSGEKPTSQILGVYKNIKKAEEERQKEIENNIQNFGFVEDLQNDNIFIIKTIFWSYQENWQNYIEYEIIKSEVL